MDLGKDNPIRLLVAYSVPAMVGQLVNAFYNLADRIFISHGVGPQAFSSMAVTGAVFLVLQSIGMLIGIGAATCISLSWGEGDKKKAEQFFGNAFLALIITSLAVSTLVLCFLEEVLLFFGASEDTIIYGADYLRVIMLGFPFMTLGLGLYHIARAVGDPTKAMLSMVISGILNIVLDALFIFAFHWGVIGAAVATVFSQLAALAYILFLILKSKSEIRLRPAYFPPKANVWGTIYITGFSAFFTQVASSMIAAAANNQLLHYENAFAVGAYGTINVTYMIFLAPVYGIGQGCQPIIGYNYGAKKFKRARKIFYESLLLAFGVGLCGWLCFQIAAQPMMSFFTNHDPDIMRYAVPGLRKLTLVFPLASVQAVGQVYFQTIGKPKITLLLSAIRQLVFMIPLFYILPPVLGTNGVWYTIPITELCALTCTSITLIFTISRMKQQEVKIVSG